MRKLKCKKGFTLMEMMVCVVLLLLVGGICTTGMDLAIKSHQRSFFQSESQNLEATLNTVLSDLLRHAEDIKSNGNGVVTFTNKAYGAKNAALSLDEGSKGFLQFANGVNLVGKKVYSENLYLENFSISYDAKIGLFKGQYIIKSTVLSDAERQCTFAYRNIMKK